MKGLELLGEPDVDVSAPGEESWVPIYQWAWSKRSWASGVVNKMADSMFARHVMFRGLFCIIIIFFLYSILWCRRHHFQTFIHSCVFIFLNHLSSAHRDDLQQGKNKEKKQRKRSSFSFLFFPFLFFSFLSNAGD